MGNNYLKQLSFVARSLFFPVVPVVSKFTVWLFDYGKQLFETTFLCCALVVFSSCSGCFQSQTARVKNADTPFAYWLAIAF